MIHNNDIMNAVRASITLIGERLTEQLTAEGYEVEGSRRLENEPIGRENYRKLTQARESDLLTAGGASHQERSRWIRAVRCSLWSFRVSFVHDVQGESSHWKP
jgi:hypothetical protein